MDAEYYYSGGIRLAEGYGFSEEVVWNYLDDPQSLPHPSHSYWMPLASVLAAGGMIACGSSGYVQARLLFLFLSAFIAPLTALAAWKFMKDQKNAFFSGLLAIVSGYYFVYIASVETFAIYQLFGVLFFLLGLIILNEEVNQRRFLVLILCLGVVCAGFYLSRADGLLWFGAANLILLAAALKTHKENELNRKSIREFAQSFLVLWCIFLVLIAPWLVRNFKMFGTLFSPSSSYMFWMTEYDQLFSFSTNDLNFDIWLKNGVAQHLKAGLNAAGHNLLTFLSVQGLIVLFPFILVGFWEKRKDAINLLMSLIWLLTFFVMSFVFPYAGYRGGFLHSASALQPFFWILIPIGFDKSLNWIGNKRAWNIEQARQVFQFGLILICAALTIMIYTQKVDQKWAAQSNHYQEISVRISDEGFDENAVVLVKNPLVLIWFLGIHQSLFHMEMKRVFSQPRESSMRKFLFSKKTTLMD